MATEFKLSYTANDINNRLGKIDSLAEKRELPTKTSELINDSGFTTETYVQEYAQPKGDYALQSDIPEVSVKSVNGQIGNVNLNAEDVGALPNTTVIPTVPTNVSAFTNDIGYLTEHQSLDGLATESYVDTALANLVNSAPEALNTLDELAAALGDDANFATTVTNQISGKLDASELPTAVNDALTQAKASGEFDGADGTNGKDGTSATHSWSGTTLTITSASGTSSADLKGEKGDAGAAGKDGEDGKDGIGISSVKQTTTSAADDGNNVITVTLTNGTTSTFTVQNGSKGSTGDKGDKGDTGANGKDGYSPVRGTDYWTDADKAEIKSYVDEAILGGAW